MSNNSGVRCNRSLRKDLRAVRWAKERGTYPEKREARIENLHRTSQIANSCYPAIAVLFTSAMPIVISQLAVSLRHSSFHLQPPFPFHNDRQTPFHLLESRLFRLPTILLSTYTCALVQRLFSAFPTNSFDICVYARCAPFVSTGS